MYLSWTSSLHLRSLLTLGGQKLSPRFFLSYARANNGPLVKKFFDDLSLTIRSALSVPRSEQIGFYEEKKYGPGSGWSEGALQALQASHAMVCLLSLPYFHSELCGKEWDVFERRRSKYAGKPAPVILTVNWITSPGNIPLVVSDLLGHPESIHQTQAITTMLKSGNLGEYAEFIKTLANKIIDTATEVEDLHLEPFPVRPEVPNAFYLWDEPAERFKDNEQATCKTAGSPDPQSQSASRSQSQTQVSRYQTFAISKDPKVLQMIAESVRLYPFDVERYENPPHVVNVVQTDLRQKRDPPELFVVDLDGGPEGVEAVKKLSEKMDVKSGILALSSNFEPSVVYEAKGATVLFRPFDRQKLREQMKHCAEIGRKIRIHRVTKVLDSSRPRQVFLSYSRHDTGLANVLRRSLEAEGVGVSYMDDVEVRGEWKHKVEDWLAQAHILLPLVTEKFLSSKWCEAELERFIYPLSQAPSDGQLQQLPLTLIAVLVNSPNTDANDFIKEHIDEYEQVPISEADFLSGLTTLMDRIQYSLKLVNAHPC